MVDQRWLQIVYQGRVINTHPHPVSGSDQYGEMYKCCVIALRPGFVSPVALTLDLLPHPLLEAAMTDFQPSEATTLSESKSHHMQVEVMWTIAEMPR